jgi:hypothetical protein
VDGDRLSFLIATGLAVLAAIIVALQLSSKSASTPDHEIPVDDIPVDELVS